MSRNLKEDYKAIALVNTTLMNATVTAAAVDVEIYEDDALVVVSAGGIVNSPSIAVVIKGSLLATPTTYDQTLLTFGAITATGSAAGRANLAGIKNIQAVMTLTGTTSANVSVMAIVKPIVKATGNNSTTFA